MNSFDPNAAGLRNGQFGGLPTTADEAEVILVPVPWDVTVSSDEGTSKGPAAILEESPQLEFLNPVTGQVWISLAMLPLPTELEATGRELRSEAREYMNWVEAGRPGAAAAAMEKARLEINRGCAAMNDAVEQRCREWLERNRVVGLVGGDHSTPLGFYRALEKHRGPFAILHLDAHCDLRAAYEGLTWSHASIMYNAFSEGLANRIVQVGVRDYCAAELEFAAASQGRITLHDSRSLTRQAAAGVTWRETVRGIVETLPQEVVVSFDIDVLEPWLCPNTGTPVPGGLNYEPCFYLLEEVVASGRRIIGFDVTEVAPGDGSGIDAIVGARVVYRLACLAASR